MAPTAQPTKTREQQQALAKARARARVSTGAGLSSVNPMEAQGQAAQREYEAAGSPALPTKPQPAPAPRVDLRNVNRAPQTQGPGYAEAKGSEIVGSDLQKGIRTIPQRIGNAAIGAVESTVNLPADLINSARQANAAYKPDTVNALRNVNRMPQMQKTVGVQKPEAPQLPTVQAPRIPIADQDQSVSGQLLEGFAQFLLARGAIGKVAKGGGIASQLGKDIATTGVAFQGNTGRVSDMIDPNSMPEGPLRNLATWLKTQPEDSPIMGRLKNMIEDATVSGPLVAPHIAVRGAQAVGNALSPSPVRPAAAAASPGPTAAAPAPAVTVAPAATPSAPVAPAAIPQAPSGAAQAGPAGAGQQPSPGPAVAPAGAAGGQGAGVLNATPTAVGQSPVALAKSDAKIIGRLLRAGGVARNDVDRLLTGLVQAYQGGNSSRLPLAFFAEEYLPTVLPKQTADDVIQKLRGYGRTAFSSNEPGNASRAVMRDTIDTLRGSQRDVLTSDFENILGKETLLNKKGKIKRDKSDVAEAVYAEELARQQRMLDEGKATPEQVAARDDLLMLMGREDYFAEVPKELKIQALDEGRSSLWEFIHQNPLEAAHWMQSRMGELASKGNSIANTMRWPLVRRLEDAVAGYRGARLDYGDLFGQEKQIKFGDDLFSVAGNKLKTDEKAVEFKKLSPAQKTVARKSIRDKLVNEFRKAKAGDDRAAVITAMQKDGVLDALETILGADGKKVADGIRSMVKENDRLRAVDNLSGSNTADNLAQMQAAEDAVRSPVNKAVGSTLDKRSFGGTIFADAVLMGVGMPPVATASKIATSAVGKFGKPSPKKLASATRTLYSLPTQTSGNALATAIDSAPSAPRPTGGPKPKAPASQADLDKLLKQYDAKPTPALRNKIIAARKALAKAQPANALASPSRPPVKMGFGGSKQPLPMDEGARMGRAKAWGGGADVVGREQASKYKFQTGKPVVVEGLHGTRGRDIKEFDLDEAGSNFSQDEGTLHFSDSADDANAYATSDTTGMPATDGAVYPVYIRMRNPLVADSEFFKREGMGDIFKNEDRISAWDAYHPFLKERAEELGADGIILKDSFGRSHYISFDPKNIRGKFAKFDPAEAGSSKLLAGMGASPEAVGGATGAGIGYFANPSDANQDGVIDDKDRGLNAMGGLMSGVVGGNIAKRGVNAMRNITPPKGPPPLDLSPNNRIFSPGKPDDLGFITSAEYVLATPPSRFKDAKALTPEQWRKFMREGGASSEAFQFQIEPALKRLADEGYTGDIPKAKLEEALARTRGTLTKPPETAPEDFYNIKKRKIEAIPQKVETDYSQYVAPGSHTGYKQHVLLLPKEQGAGYKSHNWKSENPVGHIRTTNRTSANGEKVLHVEELQSDLHQEGAKFGYKDEPRSKALIDANASYRQKQAKWYEWYDNNRDRPDVPDIVGLELDSLPSIKDPVGAELFREAANALNRVTEMSRGGSPVPRAPMENWEEPFIRFALKQGADQGVDLVTFPKWDTLHSALKNEGTEKFYDQRMPAHLANIAKSLGLKVEQVRLPIRDASTEGGIRSNIEATKRMIAYDEKLQASGSKVHGNIAEAKRELAVLEGRLADLKAGGTEVPAIRLTPEAKARLSEGVIMDAKDPGRRRPPVSNGLAGKGPPKKPRPVEARRAAPRGNKPFYRPFLSGSENKTAEMVFNGYDYSIIAEEMDTSIESVRVFAMRAQKKLAQNNDVQLPRPGMGVRPPGSTKREEAEALFDQGLDLQTVAERTGLSYNSAAVYKTAWKKARSKAPVASVEGAAYNPPAMPERPFEADYPQKDWPNGPPVDAQGRLVFDMEGRPLNQNATIVGRSKAPGVGSQSEADRPLRDKTATIQTLRNTGSEFERTPRENLPGQTDGYWNPSYADNGRFTGRGSAVIADDLDRPVMGLDDQELMTIAHELAHNIDFKTNPARSVDDYNARKWGIDPADSPGKAKVNDQLLRIYRDLNNAPGAEAKIGRPLDRGYQQAEEARELWAEAIRAYMWDPNYIKTVAPDVAFMIRHHVNRNSSLRKTIQFNAIPTIVGVGGLGLGAAALNGQPAEAKTRSSGMRANALAPAQNNRP